MKTTTIHAVERRSATGFGCPTDQRVPFLCGHRRVDDSFKPTARRRSKAGILASLLLCVFALLPLSLHAATNDLSSALQTGLFEEEANRNLPAAMEAYEQVAKQFDQNRALAATAIFRLGEVNRKLGKTNEAAAFYQRILREFGDQDTLAKLSQQNLAGMGMAGAAAKLTGQVEAAAPTRSDALGKLEADYYLLKAQIGAIRTETNLQSLALLANQLGDKALATSAGFLQAAEAERDAEGIRVWRNTLKLNRDDALKPLESRLRVLETAIAQARGGETSGPGGATPITAVLDEEEAEIRRIQAMIQNSPDLINAPSVAGLGGDTPLAIAAGKGQLRVARFLLDNGAQVNQPNSASGREPYLAQGTALHSAASAGHRAMVELLLQRGANVNAQSKDGYTALHVATVKGFQAVAEALLNGKADIDAADKGGSAPLHQAARFGRSALVGFLIARGANVDASASAGLTPLMLAADQGHVEVVKQLVAAKAKTDVQSDEGRTALSVAAEGGHLETVKVLLAAKADPNAGKVNLPLHCAIKNESAGIVEALLKAGADANRACQGYWLINGSRQQYGSDVSPLALAMTAPQLDIIKLLLANKADPNGKGVSGVPLIFAVVNDAEMMRALLDAGAKPNVDDNTPNLRTPLLMANDPKITTMLLEAGGKTETRHRSICDASDLGMTPLLIRASCWTNIALAEALLKGGADVNARTVTGSTALHFAAADKNKELMELLIAYKADVNARDNQGLTPLDYAQGKNQPALPRPGVPLPPPLRPGASSTQAQMDAASITELLRQRGGLADLPDFETIRVTRQGLGASEIVFRADTNGWNQFTLLEVVAGFYAKKGVYYSGGMNVSEDQLPFPDLARLVIHRPSRTPGGKERTFLVNLLNSTNGVDCGKDMLLEFGDTVEIPAREHALNERAVGLTAEQTKAIRSCIRKQFQVVVRGQSKEFSVDQPYWSYLANALNVAQGMILSSSDLSRVKVTRKDLKTGKSTEFIVDVAVKPSETVDLWLRDGDVIEVPEK